MFNERINNLFLNPLLKKFLSLPESSPFEINNPKKILIIVQHLSLNETISFLPALNSIKNKFPLIEINVISNKSNYFVFSNNDKIKANFILKFYNYLNLRKYLIADYDLVVVPEINNFSILSALLARFSNSKVKIGIDSIDGKLNELRFLYNKRIRLIWRSHPDIHICEKFFDINSKIGIKNEEINYSILYNEFDIKDVVNIINNKINKNRNEFLIGININAQKQINRWSLEKYSSLIKKINNDYPVKFYFAGNYIKNEDIRYITSKTNLEIFNFIKRPIGITSALVAKSDLFITNDCEMMHIAGTTNTPQISLFGCSNPFNLSPFGKKKMFIRKSDLIDDISVDDVFSVVKILLTQNPKVKTLAG